jgi:nucleotide-binding universal stress UspA family protein
VDATAGEGTEKGAKGAEGDDAVRGVVEVDVAEVDAAALEKLPEAAPHREHVILFEIREEALGDDGSAARSVGEGPDRRWQCERAFVGRRVDVDDVVAAVLETEASEEPSLAGGHGRKVGLDVDELREAAHEALAATGEARRHFHDRADALFDGALQQVIEDEVALEQHLLERHAARAERGERDRRPQPVEHRRALSGGETGWREAVAAPDVARVVGGGADAVVIAHGPRCTAEGRPRIACGADAAVGFVPPMGIARIIVTTDFSAAAAAGLDRGLAIAALHDAEVVLLHVCSAGPTMANAAEIALGGPEALARMHQLRHDRARELHDRAVAEAKKRHAKLRGAFREGPAAEQIAAAAAEEDADLVVMSARGHHAEHVFPIGSVTEAVVRRAATNVLVARPGKGGVFDRLLIATDLSEASRAVIPTAFELAGAQVDVELLHVVDWGDAPIHGSHSLRDDFEEIWLATLAEARRELDELVVRVGKSGSTIRHEVVEGVPAATIVERARALDDGLLVVGKHVDTPPSHDSVAERVVRQAPSSVLVARRPL